MKTTDFLLSNRLYLYSQENVYLKVIPKNIFPYLKYVYIFFRHYRFAFQIKKTKQKMKMKINLTENFKTKRK